MQKYMKSNRILKVLLTLTALIGFAVPSCSAVKISKINDVNITMENDALKLNVAVEGGARISSLIDKKTGKDIVTLWKSGAEDGGLLDDRNVFTSFAYRAAVMQPGGKEGVVRLTAKHQGGLSMTKTLTLRDDSSALEVQETFSNGTQQAARFMLRSFLLPNGGPLTDADQYFLPVKDKPLQPLTPANNYYADLASPWSAVWNSQSGEGVLVAAPGIDKFYFWQGSKIFPTYEWVYPDVPAGKSITVNYSLQLINDAAPDWTQLSAAALKKLRPVHFADVPGWQNEEQRFNVTDAERARGFWLSAGADTGKRRLPPLRIDAPLNQSRSVYIAINALKDFDGGDLQINLQNIPKGLVQTAWQISDKHATKVLSFDASRKIDLKNGTEGRLWLTLNAASSAQDDNGQIEISLNGQKVLLPLEVKVWPVNVPAQRPFNLHEYAGMISMIGGYKVTPETIKQANALFAAFQGVGGNTLNWTVSWPNMYPNLKIAGSEQTAADWLQKNRAEFQQKAMADWPQVDFSYYNPWIDAVKAHGVNQAMTYLPSSATAPEQEWILRELKRYLQTQGMQGFFCKISDEISPENIPSYIASAKIARRAGWRPFTTVTGLIARTASDINQLNPYMDIWEVGFGSTQFFDNVIHQKYQLQEKTVVLPPDKWGSYGNGGARDTVAQQLFKKLIPGAPSDVENVQVFQDGKPLQQIGGSAWGNKKRGVFFIGFNDYIYLSPLEGTDAKQSQIIVKYQTRVPAADGQSLAQIDPTDEVWFYGGAASYESAAAYPLKAVSENYSGIGWYDFYRWNDDKTGWYDSVAGDVTTGPVYIGLHDGWNDACLLTWLVKDKKIPVSQFISEKPDAPLRIGEQEQEVYRWKNIVNMSDPFVLNDAREKMLAAAMKK